MRIQQIMCSSNYFDPRFKKKGFVTGSNANAAERFLIEEANNIKIESQKSNLTLPMASINNLNDEPSTSNQEKRSLWTYFDQKVCHLKHSETSQADVIIEVKQYLGQNLLEREKKSTSYIWNNL